VAAAFSLFAGALGVCLDQRPVALITVAGPVDPISSRYVTRGLQRAREENAQLVVIALDTPGGLMVSMDQIVQAILSSPVPVAVYVSPLGARAASAGVFVAMAAHVAAMAPGTNIGAAHPVGSGGGDIQGAMGEKVLNDAIARLRSLAEARGRSVEWAEDAVRHSASLTDSQALARRVVDLRAADLAALLQAVDGRRVETAGGPVVLATAKAATTRYDMGLLDRFLILLVNPDLAYVLLVIGIFGIIFELSAPGIGAPGIAGGIAILLALVGFGSLPTNLGGLLFIALAVVLFVLDIKAPSHGVWTAGGIASFLLGSFLLFPQWKPRPVSFPAPPEVHVSVATILSMTGLVTAFFVFVISKGLAVQSRGVAFGPERLPQSGRAVTDLDPDGQVEAGGEVWSARAAAGRIAAGRDVVVMSRTGLRLTVTEREPRVQANGRSR
jgi:membrane-bound serine protease (ClpP class)